jgi:hypothetical protein
VLTPSQKSSIAEFVAAAVKLGVGVYGPVNEGQFPGRPLISLRHQPTRNNQRAGVNWASEYELAGKLASLQGP